MSKDGVSTFSFRTGDSFHENGAVYTKNDGNIFLGYYKAVDGVERGATKREYEQYVHLAHARRGQAWKAKMIIENSSEYPREYVAEALMICESSTHQEYRDAAQIFRANAAK